MRISDWSSDVCSSDLLQTFQFRLSDKPSCFRQPRYFTKSTKTSDKRDPHNVARPNKGANQQSGCRTPGGYALSDRATLCWPCRSEEHTSELQSLMRISYAVFCSKKKKETCRNQAKEP